ncbi:MAG: hypothetical protein ABH885_04670, partial [Candidatus Omnitrophota bacterium]
EEIEAEIMAVINLTFSLVEDFLIHVGYNYGRLEDGFACSPGAAAWLKGMVENRYAALYRIYEVNQGLMYLLEKICMPGRSRDGSLEKDVRDVDLTEYLSMALAYDTADLEGPDSGRFTRGLKLRRDLGYERVLLEKVSLQGIKRICGELRKNALSNFHLSEAPLVTQEEPVISVKLRVTEDKKARLIFENNCIAEPINEAALMLMALPGYSSRHATQKKRIDDRKRQLFGPEPGEADYGDSTAAPLDPVYGGFGFGLAKLFHEAAVAGADVEVYVKGPDGRTYLMVLGSDRIPYVRESDGGKIHTKTGFKIIVTFPRARVLPNMRGITDHVVRAAGSYDDAVFVEALLLVAFCGDYSRASIIDTLRNTRRGTARIGELDFTRIVKVDWDRLRLPFETDEGLKKVLIAAMPGQREVGDATADSEWRVVMEIRDDDDSPKSSPRGNAIAAVISGCLTLAVAALTFFVFQNNAWFYIASVFGIMITWLSFRHTTAHQMAHEMRAGLPPPDGGSRLFHYFSRALFNPEATATSRDGIQGDLRVHLSGKDINVIEVHERMHTHVKAKDGLTGALSHIFLVYPRQMLALFSGHAVPALGFSALSIGYGLWSLLETAGVLEITLYAIKSGYLSILAAVMGCVLVFVLHRILRELIEIKNEQAAYKKDEMAVETEQPSAVFKERLYVSDYGAFKREGSVSDFNWREIDDRVSQSGTAAASASPGWKFSQDVKIIYHFKDAGDLPAERCMHAVGFAVVRRITPADEPEDDACLIEWHGPAIELPVDLIIPDGVRNVVVAKRLTTSA